MNYTSLIGSTSTDGSIASWINHSSVQAQADTIVAEAESWIYRRLRHWRMLITVTGNMSTANQFISLPSDYLEDKILMVVGQYFKRIIRKTPEEVWASYCYDGNGNPVPSQPNIFYNDQTNFNFDYIPDQAYPYQLMYYQQPAPLASTNTNFLTTYYPRLLRLACMGAAAEFMKDIGQGNYDRTYWDQLAQGEIVVAQMESDRQQRSIDTGMRLE